MLLLLFCIRRARIGDLDAQCVWSQGTLSRSRIHYWAARAYGWACERLYHEFAWGYEWVAALVSLGRWSEWRRLALAEVRGRRVLELGFGTGALLVEGSDGRQMIGVEPSWEMQRVAGRRLAARGVSAPRVVGRGEALPVADGAVDSVIATFPAAYILSPDTLRECARVLAWGGRLVIGGLWVSVDLYGWERWIPVFYGRLSEEARAGLRARLEAAGFAAEIVERRDGIFRVGIVIGTRQGEMRQAEGRQDESHRRGARV